MTADEWWEAFQKDKDTFAIWVHDYCGLLVKERFLHAVTLNRQDIVYRILQIIKPSMRLAKSSLVMGTPQFEALEDLCKGWDTLEGSSRAIEKAESEMKIWPRWHKECCVYCGNEGYATRSQECEPYKYVCSDCEMYRLGYKEGLQRAQKLIKENTLSTLQFEIAEYSK